MPKHGNNNSLPTGGVFTTPQVARIAETPDRKIISFTERGYLRPSVQDADGHGSKRLWSHRDLIWVTLISLLSRSMTTGRMRDLGRMVEADSNMLAEEAEWKIHFPTEVEMVVSGKYGPQGPYWMTHKTQINGHVVIGESTVLSEELVVDGPHTIVEVGWIYTLVDGRIKQLDM